MDKIAMPLEIADKLLAFMKNHFETFGDVSHVNIPFDKKIELDIQDIQMRILITPLSNRSGIVIKGVNNVLGNNTVVYTASAFPKNHYTLENIAFSKLFDANDYAHYMEDAQLFVYAFLTFCYILTEYESLGFIEHRTVKTMKNKSLTAKKPKRKSTVKRIIRATQNVFYVRSNISDIQTEITKRKDHEWHVSEFNRRGHWRTYKNGKRVWIKPQTIKPQISILSSSPVTKTYTL